MADYDQWALWWAAGAAVVLIAAALLIWILLVARGIERHARRALEAARRIEANTGPTWGLVGALNALERVRASVKAAETAHEGDSQEPAMIEEMGR